MSRGKNWLPTVSRQFLTRNYPHPNCLLKCLQNCLSPTREGIFSFFKINHAVRVTARQLRETKIVSRQFLPRDIKVSLLAHWELFFKLQISSEPGFGAYQSLAQKIKVPFSRILCLFLQFGGLEGDFKTRAKPGYAPNSGWNAFRKLPPYFPYPSGEGVVQRNGRPKGCFWRVRFFSAPLRFALTTPENLKSRVRKRGLLEKGSFQKSPLSRDSREFRDSRDSKEPPDCGRQRRIPPFSRDSRISRF